MSTTLPPELSPHHCGRCGMWHQGSICWDMHPQAPVTVVQSDPETVQRCPVCEGCGSVPSGFYDGHRLATQTNREECRSCKGSGLLWKAAGQPVTR